jgi:DNA polymerase I-like protein with 3'-5' exonuclease and polymerase domains
MGIFGEVLQMVAKTVSLPNIRKLFLPDPEHYIIDCDLAQADAQVVAWEAHDDLLKEIFRDPNLDLHDENTKAIFGYFDQKKRPLAKAGVHATNYGASPRTLAAALGILVREAELFQQAWFKAHPGIKEWHRKVEGDIMSSRSVRNAFGYWRYYFDRIEHLLPQALAWIPQSTVALVIDHGLVNIDENLPQCENLLQVHDSIVLQFHKSHHPAILPKIRENLLITIPYEDPLIIEVGCAISDKSWGDVTDIPWPEVA